MTDPIQELRGAVAGFTQEFCISQEEEQPYWAALQQVEALIEAARPFGEPPDTNLAQFQALRDALAPFKENP